MARMYTPLNNEQAKSCTHSVLKREYIKMSEQFNKVMDKGLIYCHKCDDYLASTTFYQDNNYESGVFPICKKCLMQMVEQRQNKNDPPNETVESVQRVLCLMDLPYIDSFYKDCVKGAEDGMKERNRKSPFATYITAMKSLPNWKGLTWKDSDFGIGNQNSDDEIRLVQKTIKNGKKRFGPGYSDTDYQFLENEYQDWITRYECNTKGQEEVFESLSILKLQKQVAIKQGKPIKDIKEIDNLIQSWLDTGNLKPKQNTMDTFSDAQTMGTLLQKYEETRPLPDIDPELQDVDKIGYVIDSLYRGHTCKMLGIKNTFSHLYEKFMSKYTVTPPSYDEEEESEILFEKIFGKMDDD